MTNTIALLSNTNLKKQGGVTTDLQIFMRSHLGELFYFHMKSMVSAFILNSWIQQREGSLQAIRNDYARRQLLDCFFVVDFGISKDAIVLLVSSLLGGSLCKNIPFSSQSHQFKDEVKPRLSIPSKIKGSLNLAFIVEKSKGIPVLELEVLDPQLYAHNFLY